MNWSVCIRRFVVTIIVIGLVGLFVSFRFDTEVVFSLTQQYSFQNDSSRQMFSIGDSAAIEQKGIDFDSKNNDSEFGRNQKPLELKTEKIIIPTATTTHQIPSEVKTSEPATLAQTAAQIPKPALEPACKFPQLLVDDPLVKPYLKHYGPMKCSKEKNWVYTTNGTFFIDGDAVKRHGPVTCKYWRYDRITDDHFNEMYLGRYLNNTPINGDAFYAKCRAKDGRKYVNIHAAVPKPSEEFLDRLQYYQQKSQQKSKGLDMNILIYFMDSMSRINFMRKLPQFYKYLTEKMDPYVMEGFNIVGDGTPWAVIPMLTGHFQTELPEARKRFSNGSFVDQWPFIWKNFSHAGYVTSFAEEQPWSSPFSYKLKGFDRQPVDHYLRTMLMAVEKYEREHKPYCLGDTPRSIIWLRFWRELQEMYRPLGIRQLSMMFTGETSHDDYNLVQALDEHWVREFRYLLENNFLNDTLLIIMADHGRRFGKVRQTQTGKLEEKLPFLAFVTPPWFKKKYPQSDANLKKNRNRLVTVFDLHATFENVLNFDDDGGMGDLAERGISLFKEVPLERTCANARIKAHFCSCLDWTEITDLTNKTVLTAANMVISYFNKQLLEVPGRCANLTLGKMISARLLKPNDRLMAFKESLDYDNYTPNLTADKELHSVLYQIRFITEPGGGDWEASLTYYMKLDTLRMSYDDISRLNAYNDQAQCVINTHQHLRTFCKCL